MIETELKLDFSCVEDNSEALPVIIVAAGNSSRMKGANKQFLELDGVPVIARTLMVFEKSPLISQIILVTRSEDILSMQMLCSDYGITKLTDITEGGADRFSSVCNGIKRLDKATKKALVHDGARPLVDNRIIGNVCAALQNDDGVICAVPVKDTVKKADENNYVTETPVRSSLYAVQTPQGVNVELYKKAAENITDSRTVTDDASVMESMGIRVKIVEGSYKNIKITTPEDVALAQMLLKGE